MKQDKRSTNNNSHNNQSEKQKAKELLESQENLLASSYEKAASYANIIIMAGYACYFGLWQITKEFITEKQVLWSAFFMAVSASVFVFFEVTRTYYHSKQNLRLSCIIRDPTIAYSHTALKRAIDEHNQIIKRQTIYWGYWWRFTWSISVLSGVTAIGILMYAFVSALFR